MGVEIGDKVFVAVLITTGGFDQVLPTIQTDVFTTQEQAVKHCIDWADREGLVALRKSLWTNRNRTKWATVQRRSLERWT